MGSGLCSRITASSVIPICVELEKKQNVDDSLVDPGTATVLQAVDMDHCEDMNLPIQARYKVAESGGFHIDQFLKLLKPQAGCYSLHLHTARSEAQSVNRSYPGVFSMCYYQYL